MGGSLFDGVGWKAVDVTQDITIMVTPLKMVNTPEQIKKNGN